MNDEQNRWREAYERLRVIDSLGADQRRRAALIAECREWMQRQSDLPRMRALARLLEPEMGRRRLWSVLVPVERAVSRLRITDADILDSDRPPDARQGAPMPLKVVVDSVRSAFNAGGILRSAECFGVGEVVFCGYSPLPDQPQVVRAALGAERLVRWRYAEDIRAEIAELTGAGITCYALETVRGAPCIGEVEWRFPAALVVGNERFGLDPDVTALCGGGAVRIELYGAKNSLNVVSAFSIAAYAVRRRFSPL
jgi:23S rRNA (guanosine2251-2'-O)-methyltransferase